MVHTLKEKGGSQNATHCVAALATACSLELNSRLREVVRRRHKKSYFSQSLTRMPDKVPCQQGQEKEDHSQLRHWALLDQLPWRLD